MPEIGDAAWSLLDPLRQRDRLAALRAGIMLGQINNRCSGHGVLPYCFFVAGLFRVFSLEFSSFEFFASNFLLRVFLASNFARVKLRSRLLRLIQMSNGTD